MLLDFYGSRYWGMGILMISVWWRKWMVTYAHHCHCMSQVLFYNVQKYLHSAI